MLAIARSVAATDICPRDSMNRLNSLTECSTREVNKPAKVSIKAGEEEVKAVLDGQTEYLQVIGATGPVPSLPPERGGGPYR